jgi:hypothetical protein
MPIARRIINISNQKLLMMLIPRMGRLVMIKGSTAQCIAQATEAAIPKVS